MEPESLSHADFAELARRKRLSGDEVRAIVEGVR